MKKPFDNRKVEKRFVEISNSLSTKERVQFTKLVKKHFDEKVVSFKELPTYKITLADLELIRQVVTSK